MIFFDFDGTLVDIWPRYYAVFTTLTGLTRLRNVSETEYKNLKQMLLKDSLVAEHFGVTLPENYFERKKILLEEKEYLLLDKLHFTNKELHELLDVEDSIILTKRRNPINFYWQLEKLGISCIAHVVEDKEDWISNYIEDTDVTGHSDITDMPDITDTNKHHLIIGDALTDLNIGRVFPNMAVWMVGYGLNNETQFNTTGIAYKFLKKPKDLLLALIERRKNAI